MTTNYLINPFLANIPILYPLKTPENQRFCGVFRGYKMETLAGNGLNTNIKGTTKLYFTHYPHEVIMLFKRVYISLYFIPILLEN